MNKILLLEDDPLLAKTIKKFLEKNNFEIIWVKNGQEAIDITYEEKFDLYLFDINVPIINGDDLLLELREANDKTPCIIISALIDIKSISKGFTSGADDYIKKPFDPQELLVRIKAKLNSLKKYLQYKEFKLFLNENQLFYKDSEIFLSPIQKNIFILLLKHFPNPVTKDELLLFFDSNSDLSLRVNMTKLKQKLDIDIKNIRGVGYKLT